MIAEHAPDLDQVLGQGREAGWAFVALDGTLIETTRVAARSEAGHDLWYSGKHHHHGGNIQALTDPTGFPVWTSPIEPGSTHDITAVRTHCLGHLYPAAAAGLPTLAPHWPTRGTPAPASASTSPLKGANLGVDNRATNLAITALRAPAERANALLKSGYKALRRITLCPRRITNIVAAALVILTMQRGRW